MTLVAFPLQASIEKKYNSFYLLDTILTQTYRKINNLAPIVVTDTKDTDS